MSSIRLWAILSLVLLAAYHGLRMVASQCQGASCDIYIPLSLLGALLVIAAAAITGVIATSTARLHARAILALATLASVVGPLLSLAIFRDSPDLFVTTATILLLVLPVVALAYSLSRSAT